MQRQQTGGRLKAVLILAISLMIAGIAVFMVLRVVRGLKSQVQQAQRPPDTVDVVIAKRTLYTGLPIGPEDVVVRSLAPEMIPAETSFSEVEQVLGRTPKERILSNEVVRSERLAVKDAGIGLNAIVSPGKRAMAVAIDVESGVAGFLQPGNYVDIIVTIRPDDASIGAKWVSHAFLQGIKVLAVGRNMGSRDEKDPVAKKATRRERPTVTLELTLEEAEEMALSSSKGDIHIVLRNDIDITQVTTQGAVAQNLVGRDSTKHAGPRTKASNKGPVSEVIQGNRIEEVQFDADGSKTITVTQSKRNR